MTEKCEGGLAARLKKARAAGQRLGDRTDALNAALANAETAIAELRLGVSAFVLMAPDPDDEYGERSTSLGFARFRGKWCLVIDVTFSPSESTTTTELAECSREARVEAAALLPALVDALMEETEKAIVDVDVSVGHVERFLSDLREAQS